MGQGGLGLKVTLLDSNMQDQLGEGAGDVSRHHR